jgi:hypothetical protein
MWYWWRIQKFSLNPEVGGKWRECSTVFEVKRRNSARMMGSDGLSQCKSPSEATSCMYVVEIRDSPW